MTEKMHDPAPVDGYKPLSDTQIALMNKIKAKAKEVGELVDELTLESGFPIDARWASIGVTDLQKGFMALTRSVAKPDFF